MKKHFDIHLHFVLFHCFCFKVSLHFFSLMRVIFYFITFIHGRFRGVNVDSTFAIVFLFGEGVVFTVEVLLVGTLKRLDQLLEMDVLE